MKHIITRYSEFVLGDTIAEYWLDQENGQIGLRLLPSRCGAVISDWQTPVDPLIHAYIRGEPRATGFANGRTMRSCSPTLKFDGQTVLVRDGEHTIKTRLVSRKGYTCEQQLMWRTGDGFLETKTSFLNHARETLTLEMLTSFSLGGLSPFSSGPFDPLHIHRFRSGWCAEGRHENSLLSAMHLECSHSFAGAFCERFGQVGSMPIRGFFPWIGIEDPLTGVVWGAHLVWGGSWQMEIFRKNRDVSLSGGLADREFGHWFKQIEPGERFFSPTAVIACVQGSLDDLCARLTSFQKRGASVQPPVEHTLPIVCNEWCTTWGKPTHEMAIRLADRLQKSPVKVLVLDAGWYSSDKGNSIHGDWIVNRTAFPDGMEATVREIRKRGLIPGIWFEIETCGEDSTAFHSLDRLLKLDGETITVGQRRFWDMRNPEVHQYLSEKVIGLLQACDFGYLKIDYNETLGIGCDGAESAGEGLRRQIEGVYSFLRKLRSELPSLIIENCASGGHRLEPSFMALTAQASFSDAHECIEIPVIGANLQRLILPQQSQIWAVLRKKDDQRRMIYSLSATLLGRMCLSGDILELSEEQWSTVQEAGEFYQKAVKIIRDGTSRHYGPPQLSMRCPRGWQAVLRIADNRALLVAHGFADIAGTRTEFRLSNGNRWHAQELLSDGSCSLRLDGSTVQLSFAAEYCGLAAILYSED